MRLDLRGQAVGRHHAQREHQVSFSPFCCTGGSLKVAARFLADYRGVGRSTAPARARLRARVAVAVAFQRQAAAVERVQRRAVADRDDGRVRQPLLQQPVERGLGRLVERGGGLVEEQLVRLLQQRAGDAEPLLLAERQHAVPVRLLVEPLDQRRQPTARSASAICSPLKAPASAG